LAVIDNVFALLMCVLSHSLQSICGYECHKRSNKITIISLFYFLVSTKKLNWFTNHYWLVLSCKETGNLELSTPRMTVDMLMEWWYGCM
jgi:hypothetical protein